MWVMQGIIEPSGKRNAWGADLGRYQLNDYLYFDADKLHLREALMNLMGKTTFLLNFSTGGLSFQKWYGLSGDYDTVI
jgi:hypothetical protein